MTRVTILMIFSTLIVAILNLRDGQNLPNEEGYFDIAQYKERYDAEVALQESLKNPAPKMEGHEHHHGEEEPDIKKEESGYALTKEASFEDGAYVVKMLNKGSDGQKMVFEPTFLRIKPGDKVRFIPVDKGHMAQSIKGGIPSGASDFASKVNETYVQTFDKPGAYAVKCKPHFTMGMVAVIAVGEVDNLEQIKSLKIKGKKGVQRWNAIIAELDANN